MGEKVHHIFRLIGIATTWDKNKCSTTSKPQNSKINGKETYRRILIKRVGYEYYDKEGVLNAVLDNADEEDIDWYQKMIN